MVQTESKQAENSQNENEQKEVDQAVELRKLFIEADEEIEEIDLENNLHDELILREIDILQLPPRNEVHQPNKRVKLKFSKPFLRLLFFSLVIIAVVIATFFLASDDWNWFF